MTTSAAETKQPKLILVSGPGRSGTSSMAGTLKYLGLHIPQPEIRGNESNPRGHFEPRWVVDFHKRLMTSANVWYMDGRPDLVELVQKVSEKPEVRSELAQWLEGQMQHGQIVVKDPRTYMFLDLWRETAASLGLDTVSLSMLRPAPEVGGSRATYYLSNRDAEVRAKREVSDIAGWVNTLLVTESLSRGLPRTFVRYNDLLEDWRSPVNRAVTALGLDIDPAGYTDQHHEVDDFINPDLHRVRVTWDDVTAPTELRDLAEETWKLLSERTDDPAGPVGDAERRLDEVRDAYMRFYRQSVAVAHDEFRSQVRRARWQARTEERQKLAEKRKTAEKKAAEAEKRAKEAKTLAARAKAAPSPQVRLRRVVRRVARKARSLRTQ